MTLHEAVAKNDVAAVQRLLDRGASPRVPNLKRLTAIDIAMQAKNNTMLQLLYEAAGKQGTWLSGNGTSPALSFGTSLLLCSSLYIIIYFLLQQ